jgi:hypothetical protein
LIRSISRVPDVLLQGDKTAGGLEPIQRAEGGPGAIEPLVDQGLRTTEPACNLLGSIVLVD